MPAGLAKNLANFDDLDFRVYTGQQWQDFHKTHSKDVVVHRPGGRVDACCPTDALRGVLPRAPLVRHNRERRAHLSSSRGIGECISLPYPDIAV